MEAINESLKNVAKAIEMLKAMELRQGDYNFSTAGVIELLEKTVDILSKSDT